MTTAEVIEILRGVSSFFGRDSLPNTVPDVIGMAISALEKQEGKGPITVETSIYDTEEIHHGCAVQVLRNSVTGDVSVGWWEESSGDESD